MLGWVKISSPLWCCLASQCRDNTGTTKAHRR